MTIEANNDYTEGESAIWKFTVKEDGSVKDITGSTINWYLLDTRGDDTANATLDDDSSGITTSITDAANGRFNVEIAQGTTDGMNGNYWQIVEVDDSGDGLQRWSGSFPIGKI